MLLSIATTGPRADSLGHLLHKHPDKFQSFDLSFGKAHVFYPEAGIERAEAALLLEVDSVGLARGKNADQNFLLGQYVNDRPYAATSFLAVAIARVFGSALNGKCAHRPDLATAPRAYEARVESLPARGGEKSVREIFAPLGYEIEVAGRTIDERFPEWGASPYVTVTLRKTTTLRELLTHLYVLIPTFDARKHYYVGADELEKLLAKGEGWLAGHPAKETIARRYLRFQPSLFRMALARLVEEESDEPEGEEGDECSPAAAPEESLEKSLSLDEQRRIAVLAALKESGATRVLDLGCGSGKLLRELLKVKQFTEVVGMDVTTRALEIAERRLKSDRMPAKQAERLKILHGSLTYRDRRLAGFDAAAVVEVVEHLDPPRLAAFERSLFEFARPRTVAMTTPNREYNAVWETLPAGEMRHADHRFEWSRRDFEGWANGVASRHGYEVRFHPIGPPHEEFGSPTQMAVFERKEVDRAREQDASAVESAP